VHAQGPPSEVGVISDTHGLVRGEAIDALRGVDLIIHAGDICSASVLDELGMIAPVWAVRGNNDLGLWARRIPRTRDLELGGVRVLVIHDLKDLDRDPGERGIGMVISGHSHRPKLEWKGRVLYLNPGSAGPRRFSLPISLARIEVRTGRSPGSDPLSGVLQPRLITLG
jgi:putative phosphoesterase